MTVQELQQVMARTFRSMGVMQLVKDRDTDLGSFRVRLYTETHKYSIVAHPVSESRENGYLGCIATTRKPRAGETWNRGNDLADGPLSAQTWNAILADIVAYELVPVELDQRVEKVTLPPQLPHDMKPMPKECAEANSTH